MDSQWIALALSASVVLAGTAANIFVIGRFIGRSSGVMDRVSADLTKMEERVESIEGRSDRNDRDIDLLEGRTTNIEKAMEQMWKVRDDFIRLETTVQMSGKATQDAMDRLARGQAVMERQLANIAKSGLEYRPPGPGEN